MLQNTSLKIDLSIPFGNLRKVLDWTETNCSSPWYYEVMDTAGQETGKYRFYFSNELDYIKFNLWKL